MPQYLNELADLYSSSAPLTQRDLREANISDQSKVVTVSVNDLERNLISLVQEYADDFAGLVSGITRNTPPVAVLKNIQAVQQWINTAWDQSPMLQQIIKSLPLSAQSAASFARTNAGAFLPDDIINKLTKPNIEALVIIDNRSSTRSSVTVPKHDLQGLFSE